MRVDAGKPRKEVIPPAEKFTVHNVFILDRSGSMSGSRYENAQNGMNVELDLLKKDETVNYTQTIIEFDDPNREITHWWLQPIHQVSKFRGQGARGGTALYQTVGETIEKLLNYIRSGQIKSGEKILLKIFTDGGENASNPIWRDPYKLKDLIKRVEEENGFTVTFEGTRQDTALVVRNLGIHTSNTLSHDNTGETIYRNAKMRAASTVSYAKAVSRGEDVVSNFYTKSVEEK